jgi:hypothetical protein
VFAGGIGHNRRSPLGGQARRIVTQKGKILVVDDDRLGLAAVLPHEL